MILSPFTQLDYKLFMASEKDLWGWGWATTFKGQHDEASESSLILRESTTSQLQEFRKLHISGSQIRQLSFVPTNQASFGWK